MGVSSLRPGKNPEKWAILFASIGVTAGVTAIYLAHKGRTDISHIADATSITFDVMAILKTLEAL